MVQVPRLKPQVALGEILAFSYETFRSNKVRFALTALGMVIGTASLILVVTIGLTGKQYVLQQIQSIGANMIIAEYEGGAHLQRRVGQRLHDRRRPAMRSGSRYPISPPRHRMIELQRPHYRPEAKSGTSWCWGSPQSISGCATSKC